MKNKYFENQLLMFLFLVKNEKMTSFENKLT